MLSHRRTGSAVLAFGSAVAMVVGLAPTTQAAFTATTETTANQLQTATLASTGLTAQCRDEDRVDLSWTPSTTDAVTGYRIERRRDDENDYTPLTTVTPGTAGSYSDTDSPFPSGLLDLDLGTTVTVEYRIRAEIAGTDWRSPVADASTSGTVTSVLLVTTFSCD